MSWEPPKLGVFNLYDSAVGYQSKQNKQNGVQRQSFLINYVHIFAYLSRRQKLEPVSGASSRPAIISSQIFIKPW